MEGFDKVVWAEGVFLGQQHFQQWDRYQSAQLNFLHQSLRHHSYGVISVDWDEGALAEGRFDLLSLNAIFPNGRIVSYRKQSDGPLQFELFALPHNEYQLVLAIPNSEEVAGIAGYSTNNRVCGWRAEFKDVQDQNDINREREVMLAKPNLMLKGGDESYEQLSVLPFLKVQKQFDGKYSVVATQYPCMLTIKGWPSLSLQLQNIVDLLSARLREFSEQRVKLGDVASFSSLEMGDFLLHRELLACLVQCQQLQSLDSSHPFDFYSVLVHLHQQCAAFLSPGLLLKTPVYNHLQPFNCLAELNQQVREMLGASRSRPDAGVALTRSSPGRFVSSQISDAVFANYHFYLAVDAKQEDHQWLDKFPLMCKVASPEQVELIVASGMSGIELNHCQRPPQKVRIKSGYEYFELKSGGSLWSNIVSAGQLALLCIGEFADADIELIVVEKTS